MRWIKWKDPAHRQTGRAFEICYIIESHCDGDIGVLGLVGKKNNKHVLGKTWMMMTEDLCKHLDDDITSCRLTGQQLLLKTKRGCLCRCIQSVPEICQLTLGSRTEDEMVACERVSQLCHCATCCCCRAHNKHLRLFRGTGCDTDRS